MDKIDLKKVYKNLYIANNKNCTIVDVPQFNYLMIDGEGDPNTSEAFKSAIETLYSTAYTIKFNCKTVLEKDFVVCPLEGLWWAEDMSDYALNNKDKWKWTLMILLPDFVTKSIFENGLEKVKSKNASLPLEKIRFEKLHEGKCVQILHIGSYSEEAPAITKLHSFAKDNGLILHNKHHEIYLSDARKTPMEKLKTIIRQPVK